MHGECGAGCSSSDSFRDWWCTVYVQAEPLSIDPDGEDMSMKIIGMHAAYRYYPLNTINTTESGPDASRVHVGEYYIVYGLSIIDP